MLLLFQAGDVLRRVRHEGQEAPVIPHGPGDEAGCRKILVRGFGEEIPGTFSGSGNDPGSSGGSQSCEAVSQQYLFCRFDLSVQFMDLCGETLMLRECAACNLAINTSKTLMRLNNCVAVFRLLRNQIDLLGGLKS